MRSCTRSQFLASRTITSSLAPLSRSACACEHGQLNTRRARAPHASRAGIAPRRATSLRSQANLIFTRRGDALSGSPGSQQARTVVFELPAPLAAPDRATGVRGAAPGRVFVTLGGGTGSITDARARNKTYSGYFALAFCARRPEMGSDPAPQYSVNLTHRFQELTS